MVFWGILGRVRYTLRANLADVLLLIANFVVVLLLVLLDNLVWFALLLGVVVRNRYKGGGEVWLTRCHRLCSKIVAWYL